MMRVCSRLSEATASAGDDNGEVRKVEGHVGGRVQVRRVSRRGRQSWTCDIVFALVPATRSRPFVLT